MSRITEDDARRDYYRLLGVDPTAHPAIIKSAYRANMSELGAHPDRGGTTEKATLLNRAREVLLDPALRREYDRSRAIRRDPSPSSEEAETSSSPFHEPVSGSSSSRSEADNGHRSRSVRRLPTSWLARLVIVTGIVATIAIWYLRVDETGATGDAEVWRFPEPSIPTIVRAGNVMYDLGDGFYGLRIFRQGQWIARIDIPERFQDDLHTAAKLAILKSLRVANTSQYDRSDVCSLVVRITAPSGVAGCPVREGITAEAQLVWETTDAEMAFIVVLHHPE